MENFDEALVQILKARPGVTKQRLATAMQLEYGEEFLNNLDLALDKKIVHKVQDKYYPGSASAY